MASKRSRPAPGEEPRKFVPVEVRPRPCGEELLREHLEAWIRAFVEPRWQERARMVFQGRKKKATADFATLLRHLRPGLARPLDGSSGFPDALAERFGDALGVYLDERGLPCLLTAAEAATKSSFEFQDALWSLEPGRTALVLHEIGCPDLLTRPASS